jgi:preprotein translocase subunit SecB
MAATNGGGTEAASELPAQLNVLAQYIKDFSFENPNAPNSLRPGQQAPAINIQINVNAKPLAETDIEVELKLEGRAELANTVLFSFDLVYGGVFRVQNIPQDSVHAVMMIECPRLLFPFAREIIANAVRNGGFPPLLLDPVDFVALYRQKMNELQGQQPGSAGLFVVIRRALRDGGGEGSCRGFYCEIFAPNGGFAERGNKCAVRLLLGCGQARRERYRPGAYRGGLISAAASLDHLDEPQLRLAGADQLDIDLGQQLCVEQGAVFGAPRAIDAEAGAEVVEPVRPRRITAPRQQQGIDQPHAPDQRLAAALQLRIEEAEVEAGVMRHQHGIAEEFDEFLDRIGKARLVFEEFGREPVDGKGFRRNVPFRVEIAMEAAAGGKTVEQLDAADLDDPMALIGVETCGFGIENDLAHASAML